MESDDCKICGLCQRYWTTPSNKRTTIELFKGKKKHTRFCEKEEMEVTSETLIEECPHFVLTEFIACRQDSCILYTEICMAREKKRICSCNVGYSLNEIRNAKKKVLESKLIKRMGE